MGCSVIGKNDEKLTNLIKKIEQDFWVPVDLLHKLADDIELKMREGLIDEDISPIKMLVSYVDSLPTGDEKGRFYALDLGGTNFRVMQIKLEGHNTIDIKSESDIVPAELKTGKSHELFDFIAEKVSRVVETEDSDFELLPGRKRELGFTFSFPVHQTDIGSGTLLNWTKDFNIQDAVELESLDKNYTEVKPYKTDLAKRLDSVNSGLLLPPLLEIGKDVVKELAKARQKQALDISVTALLNDTVGTLAGSRFHDKNVVAAVILGTGMNAAYVEQSDNILKEYGDPPVSGQMVINTEWGNYSSPILPLTEFDIALDRDSPNQQKQVLEKMISGRYLGEIVRRVLQRLAEDGALFGDIVPSKLRQQKVLGTEIVSAMHNDNSADLSVVGKSLQNVLEISNVSLETKKLVVKICEIVATRAARLSAAAILSVLKRLRKDTVTEGKTVIAVDGSLFGKYDQFESCLQTTLKTELLNEEVSQTVVLKQFKDASGVGAALVAASHSFYH